jgi:hypothetical protein
MGNCSVSRKTNEDNLKFISCFLKDIEWFIFFGSLLGVVRDGRLIDQDDDIDIYVNYSYREEVLRRIESSNSQVTINNKFFIQLNRIVNGERGCIDLYFYTQERGDFILERWNFFGLCDNEHYHLKLSNLLIYPIKNVNFNGDFINVPNQSEKLVRILYGRKWNTPLKKDGQKYRIVMLFNKPVILYHRMAQIRNIIDSLYRLIKKQ